MNRIIKIGILRETRKPPDRRVPLTPLQIFSIREKYRHVDFLIQPSDMRCFSDQEYSDHGIQLKEYLDDCNILLGVKEVDPSTLVYGKKYLFFAHVGKKQPQNREMFLEMSKKKITLIDYEYLTTDNGARVVAFGRWAGIVGAYNGLRAYGIRTKRFNLKPAHEMSRS